MLYQSLLSLFYGTALAVDPIVHLNYASYRGTPLANGVTQWLGMRYAAAPVGPLRFAAPQDPPLFDAELPADKHGDVCFGTGIDANNQGMSEDCLFLDIFAPSQASPVSKLPVFFFIQGGGFNFNANANYNGSGLITAADHEMVVVTFNYRVGPYGFIASREIHESPSASVNNGLRDQRKALEWVQKYITQFGGDPAHVVLGGDSAGAASIALHLSAFGGRDEGLFGAAAAESVSFATILSIEESQYQYDSLASRLGCADRNLLTANAGDGMDETLSCLRSKSTFEFQSQNINIPYPDSTNPPLFMWNPVIDSALVQDYTYNAFDNGLFLRIPVMFGDDTNGGTIFTPRSTSDLAQSNMFLHDQFPFLTIEQLKKIDDLYPNHGPQFPSSGAWWRQVSNAYGDLRYMCPTLFISQAFARYGVQQNWNYRYDVKDPAQMAIGLGTPHTAEIGAIWGPENAQGAAPASYYQGGSNDWISPLIQGYWTSFIKTLDPNTLRPTNSPVWEDFIHASSTDGSRKVDENVQRRMLFDTKETTGMEQVNLSTRAKCRYLSSIGVEIRQ